MSAAAGFTANPGIVAASVPNLSNTAEAVTFTLSAGEQKLFVRLAVMPK